MTARTLSPRQVPVVSRLDARASALDRAIDILELLAHEPGGLGVAAISARLNRRRNELGRIVAILERRGWLQKDPKTSRYSVTYQLLGIAYGGLARRSLAAVAAPVMRNLAARINLSCHLVVRSLTQGVVVLRHDNRDSSATPSVHLGTAMELVSSCSGHVLLAFLPEHELDAILAACKALRGAPRARLLRALEKIRKRGFGVQRSSAGIGVTEISCPIRGLEGGAVAALTVPFMEARDGLRKTNAAQNRRLVEQAAREISDRLGWPGD